MSKSYKKHLETTPNFKPIVYICAPYRGDKERNVNHAIQCAAYAYSRGAIPITPHLLFPFMDDENQKHRGDAMFMDIILLGKCNELWVFGEKITGGMQVEIDLAEKRRQPIKYFTDKDLEVNVDA